MYVYACVCVYLVFIYSGACVAQRWQNELPRDSPGFNSQ